MSRRRIGRATGGLVVALSVMATGCRAEPPEPRAERPGARPPVRTDGPSVDGPTCPVVPPPALPDGSRPGRASTVEEGPYPVVRWGSGANRVVQQVGRDALGLLDAEVVTGRVARPGPDAAVAFVGDPDVGQTALAFTVGRCTYTAWLAPGVSLDDARALARRPGAGEVPPMTSTSSSLATPVKGSGWRRRR